MLWGRAANRCAWCKRELALDATETDDESLVGDVCHIVASEPGGPRGNSSLPSEQRNRYGNLILLCKVHHKLVDDQPDTYTEESLKEIKAAHEKWVRETLEYDPVKQRDDEIYAAYVEGWASRVDIANWRIWSSYVLAAEGPQLWIDQARQLQELGPWLLSRIWPNRYVELEASFTNFRCVLSDFLLVFHKHVQAVRPDDQMLLTEKFYRIPEWNPSLYDQLAQEYGFHVALVHDLMLEMTRAANYVCDKVRQFVFPTYRFAEGVLLVEHGPTLKLQWEICRVEYRDDERILYPYPGLEQFQIDRASRDVHFGVGSDALPTRSAQGDPV